MATVTFIKYKRQTGGTLRSVAQYVSQAKKTVAQTGHPLASGLNCTPRLAAQEFIATRTTHRKNSPVWFYHYVQSFSTQRTFTPISSSIRYVMERAGCSVRGPIPCALCGRCQMNCV